MNPTIRDLALLARQAWDLGDYRQTAGMLRLLAVYITAKFVHGRLQWLA